MSDAELDILIGEFLAAKKLKVSDKRSQTHILIYTSKTGVDQVLTVRPSRGCVTFRWTSRAGKVPTDRFEEAAAWANQTNDGLPAGCFCLDYDDGELYFKMTLPVNKLELKPRISILNEMYDSSSAIFDKFYSDMLDVIKGVKKGGSQRDPNISAAELLALLLARQMEKPKAEEAGGRFQEIPDDPAPAPAPAPPRPSPSSDPKPGPGSPRDEEVTVGRIDRAKLKFSKSDVVGKGGMGVVYKGVYFGQKVAIKAIQALHCTPELEKQFIHEINLQRSNFFPPLTFLFLNPLL